VARRGDVRKLRDDKQNGEVRRSEDDKEIAVDDKEIGGDGGFEDDDEVLGSEGMLMLIGGANGVDSGNCVVGNVRFDYWRSVGSNRWRIGARVNESLRSLKACSRAGDQIRCTFLRDG